jgi:hypothetical protein
MLCDWFSGRVSRDYIFHWKMASERARLMCSIGQAGRMFAIGRAGRKFPIGQM